MNSRNFFWARYQITADSRAHAEKISSQIATEQSVEMPVDAVPESAAKFIAIFELAKQVSEKRWITVIYYPKPIVDGDRTQFLNVLFGNISLKSEIKLFDVDPGYLSELFAGPSFGIVGIRKLLHVPYRPLSCTALKPVGLSVSQLADRAFQFSTGGIDIIKDDHGLTDQSTATFDDRVTAIVRAVRKGEQNSGKKTLYFPNITTSPLQIYNRFQKAVELGADGVLLSPQLTGPEVLHDLAQEQILPVMAHPAFSGTFVTDPLHGITPSFYYGTLWRAMGADCIVYPNARGRFLFSENVCNSINSACRSDMGDIKPSLPTPGGGIDRDSVSRWMKQYGNDTIFLVGGSLYQHSAGLETAAREFQNVLLDYEK